MKSMNIYRENCVLYGGASNRDRCLATINTSCSGCRFYKTREQQEVDNAKTKKRLLELGLRKARR